MDFKIKFELVRYKNRLIRKLANLFSSFGLGSPFLSSRIAAKLLTKLYVKSTTEEVTCLVQNQEIDFIRFLILFDTQNYHLIIKTVQDYLNDKDPEFQRLNIEFYFLFRKPDAALYNFYTNRKNDEFLDSVIDELCDRDLNDELLFNHILTDLIINHVKP